MCIDDNIYDEYGFSIIFNTRPKHCLRICLHRRLALARVQAHLQVRGGGVAEHQEVNLEYSQLILSLSYIIDYLVHLVQLQHLHPGQLGEVGVGKLLRGPVNPLTVGVLSPSHVNPLTVGVLPQHCTVNPAHLCLVLVQPCDVDMGEHGVGGETQAAAHHSHVLAQALSVQDHLDIGHRTQNLIILPIAVPNRA